MSTGDFSALKTLCHGVLDRCAREQISLSLPSLRVGSIDDEIIERMADLRRTGCTLAPEAGSQRLRDVINKGVSEEGLLLHAQKLLEHGWRLVKLYFMIGLPTETDEDLAAIADLCRKVRDAAGRGGPRLQVTAALSPFVPKPFTPFQWEPQDTQEMVREKQSHLREKLRIKGVTFNYHESDLSYLEACFARGDRRMGQVLLRAYQKGCMLDGWTELFKYDMWREAFAELGIDPAFYAYRRREKDEIMPWDVIDCGVTKEFLWREKEKAEKAQTTKDCRKGCNGCGLQRFKGVCKYCG